MKNSFKLGIIGHPLGHTLSPAMHRAAGAGLGLDVAYDPFDVAPEKLGLFMANLRHGAMDGVNVTIPHKLAVMEYLDEISEEARRIGAVNAIVIADGRMIGHNTDAYGFAASLRENGGVDPYGKKAMILGAGGAGRAVAWAMIGAGAHVAVANRTEDKARRIAEDFSGEGSPIAAIGFDSPGFPGAVRSADVVINATSVGMSGKGEGSLPGMERWFRPGQLAVDIVYRPLVTPFLRLAGQSGADTLDGLWMLIHQGAKAFSLWTGRPFPVLLARTALEKELGVR